MIQTPFHHCVYLLASSIALASASPVECGPWTGGVTHRSAVVKLVLKDGGDAISLLLGEGEKPNKWQKVSPRNASGKNAQFELVNLKPGTPYQYVIEVDGKAEKDQLGRFTTFPTGNASFRFAFSSCAQTGSKSKVFSTIQESDPLFFLNTGDIHYENIPVNEPNRFREAYKEILASPTQSSLYRNVPLVYMWDDHDFCGDNSDRQSEARSSARLVYQEMVPHYPLVEGEGDVAIYQSFVVGRVKFLVTDLRSERSPSNQVDDARKTMLGEKQKAWFKRELLASNGKYPLIFWVCSVPWISQSPKQAKNPPDFWGSYTTERKEISDFLAEHHISGLCLLSGDAHMLAADDGTNSDFSSGGALRIPVLHAGPLDRPKSLKGGPYSQGTYLPKHGEGCYGLVNVEDKGAEITVSYSGRNHLDEEKIGMKMTFPDHSNKNK